MEEHSAGDYGKLLASCTTMRGSFCPPADRVPQGEGEKKRERGRKKSCFQDFPVIVGNLARERICMRDLMHLTCAALAEPCYRFVYLPRDRNEGRTKCWKLRK